jgi:hypothetical protein
VTDISSKQRIGLRSTRSYRLAWSYVCAGQPMTQESSFSDSSPEYAPGDTAMLYCDPSKPERFIVDTPGELSFGLWFIAGGALAALLGLFLFILSRPPLAARLVASGVALDGSILSVRVVRGKRWRRQDDASWQRIEKDDTEFIVSFSHPTGRLVETSPQLAEGDITAVLRPGDAIRVYADPRNPRAYWVDTRRFT